MRSETQFLNATKDTPQASEDDYSVPYELKTLDGGQWDKRLLLLFSNCAVFVCIINLSLSYNVEELVSRLRCSTFFQFLTIDTL